MIYTDERTGLSVFGYERLRVYEAALQFVVLSQEILRSVARQVAACDHLARAAESIPINIAHASSSWSPGERITYLGHANGSALECAACLDVFVAKRLGAGGEVLIGKQQLQAIVNMLIAMQKSAADRIREDTAAGYSTHSETIFSHEKLDVYQTALRFTGWVETLSALRSYPADLLAKLDKTSTGIVLNIAEGNGRFSSADHVRFIGIAYKATIQSASLLDLATICTPSHANHIEEGRVLLRRIAIMLASLSKSVAKSV